MNAEITIFAANPPERMKDEREGSTRTFTDDPAAALHRLSVEYSSADYYPMRQVVIVINPSMPDPRLAEIERLRSALIAGGVKEGLVDAIQAGTLFDAT